MRADQISMDERFRKAFDNLLQFRPHTVYINLGGNDIHTTSNPKDIMRSILEFINKLNENGIENIY